VPMKAVTETPCSMPGIMKNGAWSAGGRKFPKKGLCILSISKGVGHLNAMGHGRFPVPLNMGGALYRRDNIAKARPARTSIRNRYQPNLTRRD